MKKTLLLIAFLLFGCAKENINTLDQIKKRGKLVAGVKYDTLLFGYKDPVDSQVKGFDVDLMKSLASHILGDASKIELKEVTSKTRIPLLLNRDIDIISATMTITEERKKQVLFSDVYYKAGQSLLVPSNSPIKDIKDLKGKTVLTAKGSTSAANIRKAAPGATVLEFENYQEAFTALKSKKGDALTTDNIILMGMAKQDPTFQLSGGLFTEEPYGMAIHPSQKEFQAFVNEWLKKIRSSGEYDAIYSKWFSN